MGNINMIRQMVHKHQVSRSQQIDLENLIELADGATFHDGDETGDVRYADGGRDSVAGLVLEAPKHMYLVNAASTPSGSPGTSEFVDVVEVNLAPAGLNDDEKTDTPDFAISPMSNTNSPAGYDDDQVLSGSEEIDSDHSVKDDVCLDTIMNDMSVLCICCNKIRNKCSPIVCMRTVSH